ncbi:MAG: pyridoxamine 5'-phosphate oxidase [Phycisphaerales bacterium JB038]
MPIPEDPTDLSLDPAPSNPIELFRLWYALAQERLDRPNPSTMALATCDGEGHPSVRMVLLKEFGEAGVTFYTNYDSRKAKELEATGRAALLFHWDELGLQVRIEGPIERTSAEVSDGYFASRARESQAGAWASDQSEPCEHFSKLAIRYMQVLEQYEGREIPRPPHWGGYRIALEQMEFWVSQEHRIHHRHLYSRDAQGDWRSHRLYP